MQLGPSEKFHSPRLPNQAPQSGGQPPGVGPLPVPPASCHTGSLTPRFLSGPQRGPAPQPLALARMVCPAGNALPPLAAGNAPHSLRCSSDLTLFPPEFSPTTLVLTPTLSLSLIPSPSHLPASNL